MTQPYNQQIAQFDPVGSAIKGMEAGRVLNQAGLQQQQQQQTFQQNQQLFQQRQELYNEGQEAKRANAIKSAELRTMMDDINAEYSDEKAEAIISFAPSMLKPMEALMARKSSKEKKKAIETAVYYESLAKRDPEKFIKVKTMAYESLLASEDPEKQEEGKRMKNLTEIAQKNFDEGKFGAIATNAVFNSVGTMGLPAWTELRKAQGDYRKSIATAKLTDAQTKIVGQDADTRAKLAANEAVKLGVEANKAKKANGGIFTPKDKIDYELKFANQYLKEGGDYFERADRAYMNIVNSSETGVGGLNMYLSFMKTIDPGSTVTGGEVVTAKNAPGVLSAFAQKWNSIFSEGSPSETAKEQFKKEAKNIRDNAERTAKRVKKRITNQVKGTNIDPANIFSAEREGKEYDLIKNANKPETEKTNNLIGGGIGGGSNLSPTNSTQRASSFLNKYRKN